MTVLILGLLMFLGVHSLRITGEGPRDALVQRLGANGYKGLYTLLSIAGLVLIVVGYGLARRQPVALWTPMLWARHLSLLLTWVAFVFIAAAYVPGNSLKARLRHPMTLGVKIWAFAHLLANHTLADGLLFGGFLLWSVLVFRAARARDRAAGVVAGGGSHAMSLAAIAIGTAAWAAIAMWAHARLFGVAPI